MLTDEQEQLFRAKVSQLIADRDRAREAAKAHRAGEELLQQNINALAAEKDAAEAEVKRLITVTQNQTVRSGYIADPEERLDWMLAVAPEYVGRAS